MKFRTGLIIGFGIGYVLGAKAGRERYEQIEGAFNTVMGNDRVEQIVARGRAAVDQATDSARRAMSNGLENASDAVRHSVEGRIET